MTAGSSPRFRIECRVRRVGQHHLLSWRVSVRTETRCLSRPPSRLGKISMLSARPTGGREPAELTRLRLRRRVHVRGPAVMLSSTAMGGHRLPVHPRRRRAGPREAGSTGQQTFRADRVLRKTAASKRERTTSLAVTHEMAFAAGGQAAVTFHQQRRRGVDRPMGSSASPAVTASKHSSSASARCFTAAGASPIAAAVARPHNGVTCFKIGLRRVGFTGQPTQPQPPGLKAPDGQGTYLEFLMDFKSWT
jgi:hypothetical protein